MTYAIAKFYAHVFIFYADSVKWYNSRPPRKVLNSLRPDYATEFSAQLSKIKELSKLVQRTARTASAAELRVVRLQGEEMGDDLRTGLLGIERHRAEQVCWQQSMDERQKRTEDRLSMLNDVVMRKQLSDTLWQEAGFQGAILLLENGRSIRTLPTISGNVSPAITISTEQDVDLTEPFILSENGDDSQIPMPGYCTWNFLTEKWIDEPHRVSVGAPLPDFEIVPLGFLDSRITLALEGWTTATDSTILYLEGDKTFRFPSQVSLAAAQLLKSAKSLNVPVASYFCSSDATISPDTDNKGMSTIDANNVASTTQPLIELLVTLALQVISQLPPADIIPPEMERFAQIKLFGTDFALETAFQILEITLAHAPPLLLFIIDSYEMLEVDDAAHTGRFVETLRRATKDGQRHRTLKILFTCPNRCSDLISQLDDSQIALVESSKRVGKSPLNEEILS